MRGVLQMWRRGMPALAGLLTIALVLSGCDGKNKYAAPPPAKVTVATPIQMPVTLYAEFTGNTASVATVGLEARVQGFLTSIGYRDGEAVAKGRVLFEIEKDQYQAQVDLQTAQLAAAKAKRANAEIQYKRAAALGKDEFASQRAVDDAKTNLDSAIAQVAADEASLKLAQISLAYTTVQAPFDGMVTRHLVDVGALVGYAGPTKLATILQISPIYVYFNISEQQLIDMRDALAKDGKTLKQMREERRTCRWRSRWPRTRRSNTGAISTTWPRRWMPPRERCNFAACWKTRTCRWCPACSSASVCQSAGSKTPFWSTTPR